MNELALFAGAGGGILGGHLLGWRCVCAVERDAYAAAVLAQRQNDGCLPAFPIWSDVESFDGRAWRGVVDVVSGGFPCQDISAAGKGAGITGERSGLWKEFARIIGEVGPRFVLVENSPVLTSRGLGVVLGDLAEMGYDVEWGVLGAADAIWDLGDPCADHERFRIWLWCSLADAEGECKREPADEAVAESDGGDAWAESVRGGECEAGGTAKICDAYQDRCEQPNARPMCDRDEVRNTATCECSGGAISDETEPADSADDDADGAGCARADASQSAGWVEAGESAGAGADADSDEGGFKATGQPREMEEAPGGESETGDQFALPAEYSGERNFNGWWGAEPDVGRVAHGVAFRVDRLAALGNGQVPAVVRLAVETLGWREKFYTARGEKTAEMK